MNQLNLGMLLFTLTLGHAWAAGFEGASNTKLGKKAGNVAGDDDFSVFIGRDAGYYNTTGSNNIFLGYDAGRQNTTGFANTFLGRSAGHFNTTGGGNTFLGAHAGSSSYSGEYNTFVGYLAGQFNSGGWNTHLGSNAGSQNTYGFGNVFVGSYAGFYNKTGGGNVFLGASAGHYETGSSRLYIANNGTVTPLIYGEFDNKKVTLNGNLEVIGPDNGLVSLSSTTSDNTTKAARMVLKHYNNTSLPVYLFGAVSTPNQNLLAFGGGNAIGNAATQLDFFTGPTTTTATGTSRLTINEVGNIGIGVTSPLHPLQMASGALVTSGGVWTNASSREHKENIQSLSNQDAVLTLAKLNPVTYNYKADKAQAHVGFIAEDVPELVATKDRKGLSPMDIVAVLTKVAQEQQKALLEQERVNQEQHKMMQAQQQVIAELRDKNKAMAEQTKLIPTLSSALMDLKRELRMGKNQALAD